MLESFQDDPTAPANAHVRFQEWRAHNPTGFMLNVRSSTDVMLHRALCDHFGDVHWSCEPDGTDSLTKRLKVCSTDRQELIEHTLKRYSLSPAICGDCKPGNGAARNADSSWEHEELRAAVDAYVDMQEKIRSGKTIRKSGYYRALAAKYGRTEKAFEYRMGNISYVLSLQGRAWIPGLLPRQNVGAQVAEQIERLLAEVGGQRPPAMAAFEVAVRADLRRKTLPKPVGNEVPTTVSASTTQFVRDAKVKAWVLKTARGRCECCEIAAPFLAADGLPYLEVHHIWRLAEGGPDTVSNCVALCPNCHRELHYGKDAKTLVEGMRRRVSRLSSG
jgi:5-methylcytosine-specific restriction enzyme A